MIFIPFIYQIWNRCRDWLGSIFLIPKSEFKASRLYFLDGFRALALLIMVTTHGLKFWVHPAHTNQVSDFLRSVFTKVPGPIFLFLVGASYILSRNARLRKGWDRNKVFISYIRRSINLFILAYVYKLIDYPLFDVPLYYIKIWTVDILNVIAVALFLVALCDYVFYRYERSKYSFLIGALLSVIVAPVTLNFETPHWFPINIASYFNGVPPNAFFTVFPFVGYTFFGAFIVNELVAGENKHLVISNVVKGLAICSLLFLFLYYFLPVFRAYTYITAYYSAGYLILLAGMWMCYQIQKRWGFGPLLIIGSHTMVGYWVHAKTI
jgi:uncharacterized membrane protein